MNRTSPQFTLGLIQMRASGDTDENLRRTLERCREAAADGAQIILLQELFRTPYFCQREEAERFDLAEPVGGPTVEAFRKLAAELDVAVVVPFFERRAAGVYHNSAAVVDAGGELLGVYRKTHIPDDPQYYEKFYFTPGDLGFRVFETRFASVGVLICWDQWYPEAARLTALAGAEVLVYPTAIGFLPDERDTEGPAQHDAWRTIQRSHAIANGVFVAAANRVGHELDSEQTDTATKGIDFWGGSFVCDPQGRVIAEAGADEEVLTVRCERGAIEELRRGWPFLRDRRIDIYGGITRRMIDE